MINRGGEKIYPREIEDVLLAQPGVRFAAVVAAHDEVLGQRPVAYVVPAGPWRRGLADALRAACEAALPRPKRPAAFCLVRELPLGPTGKVARHRLQELAAGRLTSRGDDRGRAHLRHWRQSAGSRLDRDRLLMVRHGRVVYIAAAGGA